MQSNDYELEIIIYTASRHVGIDVPPIRPSWRPAWRTTIASIFRGASLGETHLKAAEFDSRLNARRRGKSRPVETAPIPFERHRKSGPLTATPLQQKPYRCV